MVQQPGQPEPEQGPEDEGAHAGGVEDDVLEQDVEAEEEQGVRVVEDVEAGEGEEEEIQDIGELDDSVQDPDFQVVEEKDTSGTEEKDKTEEDTSQPGPSKPAETRAKGKRKRGSRKWGKPGGPGDITVKTAKPKPDKPKKNKYRDTEEREIPLPLMEAGEMEELLDDRVFAFIAARVPMSKRLHVVTDFMHAIFGQYTSLAMDLYILGKTKPRTKKIEKNTPIPKAVTEKFIDYFQSRFCGGHEYWHKRLRDF